MLIVSELFWAKVFSFTLQSRQNLRRFGQFLRRNLDVTVGRGIVLFRFFVVFLVLGIKPLKQENQEDV